MLDVGIDLAWGQRAWTGLAALDAAGTLVDARQVRRDEEITGWFRGLAADDVLVAIDAPIVVRNPTGARACERLLSRHFGRYHASCYPANTANPAFADGGRAMRLATELGLDVDPWSAARARAIEVYPHAALVALFDLPTVLTYKARQGRDLEHLRGQLTRLLDLLEGLATAPVAMDVAASPVWLRIRAAVRDAGRKSELRAVEDTVDAVVCAYVARYARLRPEGVRVFGDAGGGAIVTPVPAHVAAAFDREARPADENGGPGSSAERERTRALDPR